jgi:lipopolysaccharide/colanic/teichoic acid biosynthesis glycosyltransferase
MSMNASYLPFKRVLDLTLSSVMLVAASPILALCAAAVKASSSGPAIFRQERIGLHGRRFSLLKFRSMRVQNEGPLVTSGDDPRVTGVGKVLRATKLDELPQLINVIRGDMSLVGPRPEVPRYVEMFANEYERVLRIRPGITDYAAIRFRHEEKLLEQSPDPERMYIDEILPQKLRLYEEYLANCSFSTDVAILLRTVAVVLK